MGQADDELRSRGTTPARVGCWLSLLTIVLLVTSAVVWIYPKSRYGFAADRINKKITGLLENRPQNVSHERWEVDVTWASIAFCNICFSESHAPYEQMIAFEKELDERIEQSPNLETFPWIWDRLAATGPRGKSYVVRFREQWQENARSAEKSN